MLAMVFQGIEAEGRQMEEQEVTGLGITVQHTLLVKSLAIPGHGMRKLREIVHRKA